MTIKVVEAGVAEGAKVVANAAAAAVAGAEVLAGAGGEAVVAVAARKASMANLKANHTHNKPKLKATGQTPAH